MPYSDILHHTGTLLKIFGVAALYAGLAHASHLYVMAGGAGISAVWPSSGLALAAILIGGKRYAWSVIIGSLLMTNIMATGMVWADVVIATGNTLAALMGALLLGRNGTLEPGIDSLRDFLRLILLGGCAASIVSALFGNIALLISGLGISGEFLYSLMRWWMADVLGILLVTPLILSWHKTESAHKATAAWKLEFILLLGLVFLIGQIVFLDWFHDSLGTVAKVYWTFLLIVWVAARLGARGVTVALCMTLIQALLGAYDEIGIFEHDIEETQLVNFWFYMVALSVVGIVLAVRITQRKQAEDLLRMSEERWKFALEGGGEGVWDWDIPSGEMLVTKRYEEMLGYDENEIEPSIDAWTKAVHPEDMPRVQETLRRYLDGQLAVYEVELRMHCKGGGWIWVICRGMVVTRDADGKPVRMIGTHLNITGRKQAEDSLRASEERFRSIIEAAPVPFALNGDHLNITYLNASFINTFGYTLEDIPTVAEWWPRAYPDPAYREWVKQAWISALEKAKRENKPFEPMELTIRCKDGNTRTVMAAAAPIGISFRDVHLVSLYDITERKQAELRFRTVADFTYDWEAWVDLHGRWLYCSPSCMRITGHNADEFIANPQLLLDIVHPEDRNAVLPIFKGSLTEADYGRTSSFRIKHKEGRIVWIELVSQPVFDDVGLCMGFRTSSRDITERKQAEDKLRKLSLAVEQSFASVVITDLDANIEYVNQTFTRETGYSLEEALGQNPRVLNSGKNPKEVYREMWSCLARGEAWRGELVNRRKDGSEYVESALISPVCDTDGNTTHYLAIKENITERKHNESRIDRLSRAYRLLSLVNEAIVRARSKEELFAAICDATVESALFRFVWIGVLDEQKIEVTPVAYVGAEAGYMSKLNIRLGNECTCNGPIGRAMRDGVHIVCHDIANDPCMAPWCEETVKRGYMASGVFPFRNIGVVAGSINAYAEDANFFTPDIIRLMLELAADVSFALDTFTEKERREWAENEIRQLNSELEHRVMDRTRQLEALNKELEAFSYSVSHDLRAPLRGIDGFSRNLYRKYHDQLDDTGRDWLERICRASQRMGCLIDDMLKLSQVTRSPMKRELVNLSGIAENVVEDLRKAHPERQARFVVQQGLSAQADPGMLHIVMNNLLGNAWKFTGKRNAAEIEFGMSEVDGEQIFFVRDNGDGFNMEYAHKLFGAFQRLHGESEFDGTGIGLATVQRVIRRHNGKIWAEAIKDQGATFYFKLPQRSRRS